MPTQVDRVGPERLRKRYRVAIIEQLYRKYRVEQEIFSAVCPSIRGRECENHSADYQRSSKDRFHLPPHRRSRKRVFTRAVDRTKQTAHLRAINDSDTMRVSVAAFPATRIRPDRRG